MERYPLILIHHNVRDFLSTSLYRVDVLTVSLLMAGGSIQDTRTNEFSSHRWVCRMGGKTVHVPHRKHYRMVLDIVGYDLRSMRGTEELLHAGYDVLVGASCQPIS